MVFRICRQLTSLRHSLKGMHDKISLDIGQTVAHLRIMSIIVLEGPILILVITDRFNRLFIHGGSRPPRQSDLRSGVVCKTRLDVSHGAAFTV